MILIFGNSLLNNHYRMCSRLRSLYKSAYIDRKEYHRQLSVNKDAVQFYNWWNVPFESLWLCRFVHNSHLLDNSTKQIRFCSLFGSRHVLDYVPSGVKVFFSGENLHHPYHASYADSLLGDSTCDLSLGFDCFEDERYWRFPLWLTYVFEPTVDHQQIVGRCAQLRYPIVSNERNKFASLIARLDFNGLRTEMYQALSHFGKIDCPSQLLHNDDSLHKEFDDDKIEYLKHYRFNLCPENSNSFGYVTEKVFEAIMAGCIPIYWGCYNNPEPGILNKEAVLLWDRQNNGVNAARLVEEMQSHPSLFLEYASQPRLLSSAEEKVEEMIVGLYDRLKDLINNI